MEKYETISHTLFADVTKSVYAVLDGASIEGLITHLDRERPEAECLFRGDLAPGVAAAVPYLVHLKIGTSFTDWIIREGWGKHWGIFALSASDLRTLRQHFRDLLTVYDPNAKPLLFRYYDPRVLRTYLPTCNREELEIFFGPVSCFIAEGENASDGWKYANTSGTLKVEKL